MATHGLLKKVWDNEKNWGLIIDVDDHGEHKLNLWDWKYAGKPSEETPVPICDIHAFVGQRIIYTATKGNLKSKDGPEDGERWPATVTEIALETSAEKLSDPQQPPEDVEPVQVANERDTNELRRLTSMLIQAAASVVVEAERLVKEV